jgi:hypothetical protein
MISVGLFVNLIAVALADANHFFLKAHRFIVGAGDCRDMLDVIDVFAANGTDGFCIFSGFGRFIGKTFTTFSHLLLL